MTETRSRSNAGLDVVTLLAGKAPSTGIAQSAVTSLVSDLAAKAPSTGIAQSAVTNLVSDLAAKASDSATTASLALKADIVSETVTDYTLATNVLTMDLANGNVGFIATAPTAAMTFNFTNVPTTNGKAVTVSVFVTQGATGYIPTTLQIAASAQTIKWPGGTAPTATSGAGKIDVFSFTFIRRSSAWTVLGSSLLNF